MVKSPEYYLHHMTSVSRHSEIRWTEDFCGDRSNGIAKIFSDYFWSYESTFLKSLGDIWDWIISISAYLNQHPTIITISILYRLIETSSYVINNNRKINKWEWVSKQNFKPIMLNKTGKHFFYDRNFMIIFCIWWIYPHYKKISCI